MGAIRKTCADEYIAKVIRARRGGMRPIDIARTFGLTRSQVNGVLHRNGLTDPNGPTAHCVPRSRKPKAETARLTDAPADIRPDRPDPNRADRLLRRFSWETA